MNRPNQFFDPRDKLDNLKASMALRHAQHTIQLRLQTTTDRSLRRAFNITLGQLMRLEDHLRDFHSYEDRYAAQRELNHENHERRCTVCGATDHFH